ncbi:hypothetical protein CDAR_235151 [Caerostris darwini]|uniref:Uncharacterized protein n=1 Tax=Caerostris darwini TaxID=1538125 RepID=A0AAV4MPT7_9ARAC|nr:hypothetical protein CDAR_235151 [Caerostris darwini]
MPFPGGAKNPYKGNNSQPKIPGFFRIFTICHFFPSHSVNKDILQTHASGHLFGVHPFRPTPYAEQKTERSEMMKKRDPLAMVQSATASL